ncbi:glycosyltransferase [Yasminevirus sp. GU-2018]|uniref:Glycosyltransferase n=1 Tax=Yasminevirus sp. GU-2018 TaxID=2420051 RepID=A0A5K0UAL1_9VIRU|nr:glycosyltransferase [Yasminevirus sp. GU-2018]
MRGLIVVDLHKNTKLIDARGKYNRCAEGKCLSSVNNLGQHAKQHGSGGTKITGQVMGQVQEFTYGEIVDLLIKAQKLRYQYPTADLACRLDANILADRPDIERVLSAVYDKIVVLGEDTQSVKKQSGYDVIKVFNREQIGAGDSFFDDDFEYEQLKKSLGPVLTEHFMFKEHDIEIQQRGGFNFNKKKIKFKKEFDPSLNSVCELYNIDCKLIKHQQLRYYHTSKNRRHQPFKVTQMFDNVDEYDYLTPLMKLAEYHSDSNYYKKLLSRTSSHLKKAYEDRVRLNLIDSIDPDDRDCVALQYIKCRKNTFAITLWRPAIPALNKFVELLEREGEVYYIKTVSFTRDGLRNLLCWYYDDFSTESALRFIESKMQYIDTTDDNNPVCMILFDNTHNKRISGQAASFKQYLRKMVMEYSGVDPTKYRGNDMMHINDHFYQTVEYSQLLLNDNSIEVINKQDTRAYLNPDFTLSNLKMQTLRNVIYSNMSLLEMDRLITVGGTVFYAHGMRSFNDVDAILIGNEPNVSTHLIEVVERHFSNRSTKFYFLDAGIQGSKSWNDSWTKKDQKIMDFLKIDNFKDLTLDPKNFFYFQGIKMVTLEYEMIRKLIRNRTEDHVDFMMMNLLYKPVVTNYVTLLDVFEPPYFSFNPKYKNIVGDYDDRFPGSKLKILKRRYTTDQINKVQNDERFRKFFNIEPDTKLNDDSQDNDSEDSDSQDSDSHNNIDTTSEQQ